MHCFIIGDFEYGILFVKNAIYLHCQDESHFRRITNNKIRWSNLDGLIYFGKDVINYCDKLFKMKAFL